MGDARDVFGPSPPFFTRLRINDVRSRTPGHDQGTVFRDHPVISGIPSVKCETPRKGLSEIFNGLLRESNPQGLGIDRAPMTEETIPSLVAVDEQPHLFKDLQRRLVNSYNFFGAKRVGKGFHDGFPLRNS